MPGFAASSATLMILQARENSGLGSLDRLRPVPSPVRTANLVI